MERNYGSNMRKTENASFGTIMAETFAEMGGMLRSALPFLPWAIVPFVFLWIVKGILS